MQEGIVDRGSCIVELYSIWAFVEADVESVRLVAVAKLRELIWREVVILRPYTKA
jgi:hypothetical protein